MDIVRVLKKLNIPNKLFLKIKFLNIYIIGMSVIEREVFMVWLFAQLVKWLNKPPTKEYIDRVSREMQEEYDKKKIKK